MSAPKNSRPTAHRAGRSAAGTPALAQNAVRRTLRAMRGEQRLVLALHFYEHLGATAIARTLGAPVSEVERLLHSGKEEVARALAQSGRRLRGSDSHAA